MKVNKAIFSFALAFLLSSFMQQGSPASSHAESVETSSIAEQSMSSEVSQISEAPIDSSETSKSPEIYISEFAVKFAKETGGNHLIVKRIVDGQERYYIAYDEVDALTKT